MPIGSSSSPDLKRRCRPTLDSSRPSSIRFRARPKGLGLIVAPSWLAALSLLWKRSRRPPGSRVCSSRAAKFRPSMSPASSDSIHSGLALPCSCWVWKSPGRRSTSFWLAKIPSLPRAPHPGSQDTPSVAKGTRFDTAYLEVTGETLEEAEHDFWSRHTFFYRWVPILGSSATLWLLITGLALLAFQRRRAKDKELRQAWELEAATDRR